MNNIPAVRDLRKLVEALFRTFDDLRYVNMGPQGPIIVTNDGRKIEVMVVDSSKKDKSDAASD